MWNYTHGFNQLQIWVVLETETQLNTQTFPLFSPPGQQCNYLHSIHTRYYKRSRGDLKCAERCQVTQKHHDIFYKRSENPEWDAHVWGGPGVNLPIWVKPSLSQEDFIELRWVLGTKQTARLLKWPGSPACLLSFGKPVFTIAEKLKPKQLCFTFSTSHLTSSLHKQSFPWWQEAQRELFSH